jgi:phage-related minor tail protein
MSDLDVTGRVVVDSSQAEGAFKKVDAAADKMAQGIKASADKASKAADSIGDGADQGAQKFTRAGAQIRNEIQRSTLQLESFGKTASQRLELKITAKGLDPAQFAPYLAELKKVEAAQLQLKAADAAQASASAATGYLGKVEMSARATSAALRGVPAQFTDIITSLQGGQAPLTVFLQQGGQLKDMFGGFGNAARALQRRVSRKTVGGGATRSPVAVTISGGSGALCASRTTRVRKKVALCKMQ